jgi:hypothetical protein
MSRQKLRVVVGLVTGHTTLAHMFKLGLTQRQDCRLCRDRIESSVRVHMYVTVHHWHPKRYRTLGCKFWKPKDLENMRVYGLLSLVAHTRLGVIT